MSCPKCGAPPNYPHAETCDNAPMLGPNLLFGEPAGQYEIEITPTVAWFIFREKSEQGRKTEIKIPLTHVALSELKGLLNLLDTPGTLSEDLRHVRVRGHA